MFPEGPTHPCCQLMSETAQGCLTSPEMSFWVSGILPRDRLSLTMDLSLALLPIWSHRDVSGDLPCAVSGVQCVGCVVWAVGCVVWAVWCGLCGVGCLLSVACCCVLCCVCVLFFLFFPAFSVFSVARRDFCDNMEDGQTTKTKKQQRQQQQCNGNSMLVRHQQSITMGFHQCESTISCLAFSKFSSG